MRDLFLSKPGKRYGHHFLLPSNQMRGITSPTSCPHCHCQQSQWIESLAFTDLTRCNELYRWHHWFIATSYDLLLSHRQHRHLPPPPLDDNQNDNDNDKEEGNKDEDDSDKGDEDKDDINNDNDSKDDDDDDNDNNNNDDEYYIHDNNSDSNCNYNKED